VKAPALCEQVWPEEWLYPQYDIIGAKFAKAIEFFRITPSDASGFPERWAVSIRIAIGLE